MKQTQVVLSMLEQARSGALRPPRRAVVALAAVIAHLDMYSDTYEADVAALTAAGASDQWAKPNPRRLNLSNPGLGLLRIAHCVEQDDQFGNLVVRQPEIVCEDDRIR